MEGDLIESWVLVVGEISGGTPSRDQSCCIQPEGDAKVTLIRRETSVENGSRICRDRCPREERVIRRRVFIEYKLYCLAGLPTRPRDRDCVARWIVEAIGGYRRSTN